MKVGGLEKKKTTAGIRQVKTLKPEDMMDASMISEILDQEEADDDLEYLEDLRSSQTLSFIPSIEKQFEILQQQQQTTKKTTKPGIAPYKTN
jgi:hypothetical protein